MNRQSVRAKVQRIVGTLSPTTSLHFLTRYITYLISSFSILFILINGFQLIHVSFFLKHEIAIVNEEASCKCNKKTPIESKECERSVGCHIGNNYESYNFYLGKINWVKILVCNQSNGKDLLKDVDLSFPLNHACSIYINPLIILSDITHCANQYTPRSSWEIVTIPMEVVYKTKWSRW